MNIHLLPMCAILAAAACNSPEGAGAPNGDVSANALLPDAPTNVVTTSTPTTDQWVGKWVGVEGLALEIARGEAPGTYALKVVLMDETNDYAGRADGDVIRFTRDGAEETIRHVTGEATELKWLAEKKDCLMIKPGEGFCRD